MSSLQLSSSQKRVLTSLVNLSEGCETAVRGKDIAEAIDRNPGTVRNRMQSLRALQLVEGVPGPKGGYKPTASAYETLDVARMDESAAVPVERNGDPLPDVTVEGVELTSVHHPELCRAEVTLRGPTHPFEEGDGVTVGPTPSTGLRISGVVDAANVAENALIVRIRSMTTAD